MYVFIFQQENNTQNITPDKLVHGQLQRVLPYLKQLALRM